MDRSSPEEDGAKQWEGRVVDWEPLMRESQSNVPEKNRCSAQTLLSSIIIPSGA